MFGPVFKSSVAIIFGLTMGSVMAAPIPVTIDGTLNFSNNNGDTWMYDGSGAVVGFDFDAASPNGTLTSVVGEYATVFGLQSTIPADPIDLFDINSTWGFTPTQALLATVVPGGLGGTVAGTLTFLITSLTEFDNGTTLVNDIRGAGYWTVDCASADCDTFVAANTIDPTTDQLLGWEISGTSNQLSIVGQIPEPATLGILGLGLLGLSAARRRMRKV